jgi:hypothetical protein
MLGHGTLKVNKDEDLCDDNKNYRLETEWQKGMRERTNQRDNPKSDLEAMLLIGSHSPSVHFEVSSL